MGEPQGGLYTPSIRDHSGKDFLAVPPVTHPRFADAGPTWIYVLHLFEEKLRRQPVESVGFVALHPVRAAPENVQLGVGELLQQ